MAESGPPDAVERPGEHLSGNDDVTQDANSFNLSLTWRSSSSAPGRGCDTGAGGALLHKFGVAQQKCGVTEQKIGVTYQKYDVARENMRCRATDMRRRTRDTYGIA